jgi:hypothetical protein
MAATLEVRCLVRDGALHPLIHQVLEHEQACRCPRRFPVCRRCLCSRCSQGSSQARRRGLGGVRRPGCQEGSCQARRCQTGRFVRVSGQEVRRERSHWISCWKRVRPLPAMKRPATAGSFCFALALRRSAFVDWRDGVKRHDTRRRRLPPYHARAPTGCLRRAWRLRSSALPSAAYGRALPTETARPPSLRQSRR